MIKVIVFTAAMLAACGEGPRGLDGSGVPDAGKKVAPRGGAGSGDALGTNQSGEGVATPRPPGDDGAPPQALELLSEEDAEAMVAADFAKQGDRNGVVYLSIAHLKGFDADEREAVRFGIEKTLNSLSQAPQIRRLAPLDDARTVFRMKLADYGWNGQTWALLARDKLAAANVKTVGGATVAKGDWLVFAATRPEAYDKIIGIPQLESMLDSRLGVDKSKAKYLGVHESIVTYNGRLLERVPIKTGYYWRSYDFLFGADQALAKAEPTYARGRSVSELIAGEFIWSLPNGLQAYMLSGFGAQHRYDAQASVARDSRRQDKLVLNGESCITCHANGLNVRKNEVDGSRFPDLYPSDDEMGTLFEQDNARYAAALKQLGYDSEKLGEPIGRAINTFKQDRGVTDFRQQRGETDAVFGN